MPGRRSTARRRPTAPPSGSPSHPSRLAAAVAETGATAAILDSVGYLGPALRLAGFAAHIVGVEHGALIPANQRCLRRRAPRLPGRILGLPAYDAELAVSAYAPDRLTPTVPGPGRFAEENLGLERSADRYSTSSPRLRPARPRARLR